MTDHKFKIGQLVNYLGRERASVVYKDHTATAARRRSVSVSHQERQRTSRADSQRERAS